MDKRGAIDCATIVHNEPKAAAAAQEKNKRRGFTGGQAYWFVLSPDFTVPSSDV